MTFNIRQLAGVALVAVALTFDIGGPGAPAVTPVDIPKPAITVVLPEVQDERKSSLADFYMALGEMVAEDGERPEPQLADTATFARMHASALGFAIKREDIGTVPGLAEAIDKAFSDNLGDEVQPLDGDGGVRAKLAEICTAIAWSVLNG